MLFSVPTLAGEVEAAVGGDDVSACIETDRAFHAELVAQAGNPLLTRMVLEKRDNMRLYGIDTSDGRKRQQSSIEEHSGLIDLVEARSAEKAAKLMSSHILTWKPIFTEAIQRRGTTVL